MKYTYRMYNAFSDKASHIYREGELVGFIQKYYPNVLMKLVENLFSTTLTNRYRVINSEGVLLMEAKMHQPLKKRQYDVYYYGQNETQYVHLLDNKAFELGESTAFTFNNEIYYLYKSMFGWGEIKNGNHAIARWKGTLSWPPEAQFELLDQEYARAALFFLGVFHAFCFN